MTDLTDGLADHSEAATSITGEGKIPSTCLVNFRLAECKEALTFVQPQNELSMTQTPCVGKYSKWLDVKATTCVLVCV